MTTLTLSLMEWFYTRMNDLFSWLLSLWLSGRLGWIARDWKTYVIGIVLFGLAADLIVHFVRYRPDRRWRTRFARLAGASKATAQRAVKKPSQEKAPLRTAVDEPTQRKMEIPPREAVPPPKQPTALEEPTLSLADVRRRQSAVAQARKAAPPKPRNGPTSAELFQPAPPMEAYDGEPSTYQPERPTHPKKDVEK